jgi:hypothetical protein
VEEETIQPAATLTYGLFEHLDLAVEYEISEALELVGNIGVETNKDKATDWAFLAGITLRFYCALNGIRKILHNNVSRS